MSIKELGILLSCLMPLVKISDNKFLLGAEKKEFVIRSDRILVKGATGFKDSREFISRYALSECLVIWRTMQ